MNHSRLKSTLVAAASLATLFVGVGAQNSYIPQGSDYSRQSQSRNYGGRSYTASGYGQNGYSQPSYSGPDGPQPGRQLNSGAPQGGGSQPGWLDAFNRVPANVVPSASVTPSFTQEPTSVRIKPAPKELPLESGITARDLQLLGQHDVAIVVDRSYSMRTPDCPGISSNPAAGNWQRALAGLVGPGAGFGMSYGMGNIGMSRWEFVQSQTVALARQTEQVFPNGIMLVMFSSHAKVFKNVDLRQIPNIFSMTDTSGGTNTAEAIARPIEDYFARRQMTGGRVKPLVVAVITDGLPTNFDALEDVIVETTRQMRNPNEIKITFLQIGADRKGFRQLSELQSLANVGAKYDIVNSKMFPQVVQSGLARSLVDAIEGRK